MSTPDPNNYFFGYIGVASALVFANLGAAYGSAKAGVGICSMGVLKPDLIMKSVVPVVMAGILGIYGMIVAVIIVQKSTHLYNPSPRHQLFSQRCLCSLGIRTVLRIQFLGSRTGNWYCRWCRCACQCSARQNLCGYDFDSYFWIGSGFVWFDCVTDFDISRLIFVSAYLYLHAVCICIGWNKSY